jgi:ADP-ribose pyrophosphatase
VTAGPGGEVEVLGAEVVYRGFFRLLRYRLRHKLFRGGWSPVLTRELLERGHAVAVLPYDPVLDKVVLVEQFRIGALTAPAGPWLLETIAGIAEPAEELEAVARRESVEEAGCDLGELVPICDYLVSPGGSSEWIALFCARVDAAGVDGVHGLLEEGEDIRPTAVPWAEAWRALQEGRILSATPIIALQWLALNREELRKRWNGELVKA